MSLQFLVLCAVLITLGQLSVVRANNLAVQHDSIAKLIATPNKYDGMLINVTGYLLYDFDSRTQLSLCATNGSNRDLSKKINLKFLDHNSRAFRQFRARKLRENYVAVSGYFERSRGTHVSCISVLTIENAIAFSKSKAAPGELGARYAPRKVTGVESSPIGDFWVRSHADQSHEH